MSASVQEPGPTQAQHQEQHQRHAPWYSLLSCRLLSFIGGGPGGTHGDEEYTASGARPVLSSHRLNLDGRRSIEHRLSESSIRSIRCEFPTCPWAHNKKQVCRCCVIFLSKGVSRVSVEGRNCVSLP